MSFLGAKRTKNARHTVSKVTQSSCSWVVNNITHSLFACRYYLNVAIQGMGILAFHALTATRKNTAQTFPILSPDLPLIITVSQTVPVLFGGYICPRNTNCPSFEEGRAKRREILYCRRGRPTCLPNVNIEWFGSRSSLRRRPKDVVIVVTLATVVVVSR